MPGVNVCQMRLFVIIPFVFVGTAFAQDGNLSDNSGQTGTIVGVVTDEVTGELQPGVNVVLIGTSIGVVSDLGGHYRIDETQAGTYEIVASFIGYEPIAHKVVVRAGATTELNFGMEDDPGFDPRNLVLCHYAPMLQRDIYYRRVISGGQMGWSSVCAGNSTVIRDLPVEW